MSPAAYFNESRVSKVRQAAVGGGANLWRAVKLAKNLNSDNILLNLTLDGNHVAPDKRAECFAGHFSIFTRWFCNQTLSIY